MKHLEYSGGLGDVLWELYRNDSFNSLNNLKPDERARVVLICTNPHAAELFTHHPKANQIDVTVFSDWLDNDQNLRKLNNLPDQNGIDQLPYVRPESVLIKFTPSSEDITQFEMIGDEPFVLISATAGTPERNIPKEILKQIVSSLVEKNIKPIFVGRNYYRLCDRKELESIEEFGCGTINMIDRLTVPGTCFLLNHSLGLVTGHTALLMLAWRLRKPVLCLYPKSVVERHFRKPDRWSSGIDNGYTIHGLFNSYNQSMQKSFERIL